MFAVIIPYFQRERGILARTLDSVARQDVDGMVNVYVVDDGSPVPPEPEVEAIAWPDNFRIRILKQDNGGPGSARNLALNSLNDEKYVAFLDSDDCWHEYHLSAAAYAFGEGFDFYTADTLHEVDGTRVHARYFNGSLPLHRHGEREWAHELAEPIINFTVAGPISGVSTMTVTRRLVGDTRFDERLRTCGEDGLFATSIAAKGPRVMVSRRIDTVKGRGVNIFSSGGWGTCENLMRNLYFLQSRLKMRPLVSGFPVAQRNLEAVIVKARRGACAAAFATLRRGGFPLESFLRVIREDPALIAHAPAALARSAGFRRSQNRFVENA